MSRRAVLPGASELFRATGPRRSAEEAKPDERPNGTKPDATKPVVAKPAAAKSREAKPATSVKRKPAVSRGHAAGERRSTGREKHDEKITVYVSAEELVELERARLSLRAEHGLAVDRGRIVREAIAILLADLDTTGENSALVRRLRGA